MPRTPNNSKRKYYARYIRQYTRKNRMVIVLGALFVLGVVFGCLLFNGAGDNTINLLDRMLGAMITTRRASGLYDNFLSAVSSSLLFAGGLFICGFCAIAQPIIIAAPFVRGLGFGLSMASLYAQHGSSAIGFVGVLILPGMLFSTVGILLCCRQALKLSGAFFRSMLPHPQSTEGYPVKSYCLSFALAVGLCVAAAFLEAILYFGFANSLLLG